MFDWFSWVLKNSGFLNFLAVTATLIVVIRYTRAAFEQAEAGQKPFVCLFTQPVGTSREGYYEEPYERSHLGGFVITFVNRGTWPALNLRFILTNIHPSGVAGVDKSPIPHLSPGFSVRTRCKPMALGLEADSVFLAVYESLTGQLYETREVVRNVNTPEGPKAQIVDFSFWRVPRREVPEARASVSITA